MGTLISIIPILESILIRGVYKDWFQNNCSVVNYNELKTYMLNKRDAIK